MAKIRQTVDIDMDNNRLENLADGIAAMDAVNLQQLQAAIAGVTIPDASETTAGKIRIATQAETTAGTVNNAAVVPSTLAAVSSDTLATANSYTDNQVAANATPSATETVAGKAELATQAEANAGADDITIVTPLKMKGAIDARGYATTSQVATGDASTLSDANIYTDNAIAAIPDATTSVKGKIQLATSAEVIAGTDPNKAVTPATLTSVASGSVINALDGERNILLNAEGVINQRQAFTAVADNAFSHDCWYVQSQTAAIDTFQLSDIQDGIPNIIQLTQVQAASQRIGYAQAIEASRSKFLRGRKITISGVARRSSSGNIRWALIEWTGTADAISPRDNVADWTSGSYTAGGFFNSTSRVIAGTGANTFTANTIGNFTPTTVQLSSSLNNLIFMVWSEGTLAQNATMEFRMQVEPGEIAANFTFTPFPEQFRRVKRFYQKTLGISSIPQNGGSVNSALIGVAELNPTGNIGYPRVCWRFDPPLVKAPTVTTYNVTGGSSGQWRDAGGSTNVGASVLGAGTESVTIHSSGSQTCSPGNYLIHAAAEANISS